MILKLKILIKLEQSHISWYTYLLVKVRIIYYKLKFYSLKHSHHIAWISASHNNLQNSKSWQNSATSSFHKCFFIQNNKIPRSRIPTHSEILIQKERHHRLLCSHKFLSKLFWRWELNLSDSKSTPHLNAIQNRFPLLVS